MSHPCTSDYHSDVVRGPRTKITTATIDSPVAPDSQHPTPLKQNNVYKVEPKVLEEPNVEQSRQDFAFHPQDALRSVRIALKFTSWFSFVKES